MKSKTKFSFICLLLMPALIQFTSCTKDSTNGASGTAFNANDAVLDSTIDSTLKKGLVAWYPFNGDVKDHSGKHNDVIYNTATPAKGENGIANSAYKFDGLSSYMQVNNSNSLNPSKITLFVLFKTTGFYQGNCHSNRIISKGYNDYDYGRYALGYDDMPYYNYQGCYSTVMDSLESPYGTFGDGQATASGTTATNKYIQKGKWLTLGYIYNGTESKLYLNGNLVSVTKTTTYFTPNENTPLFFGRNEDAGNPYNFTGLIDDLRIYNRALNATEMKQLDYLVRHQN